MKKITAFFLTIAFTALASSCVNTSYEDEYMKASKILVGDKIPEFTLTSSDNRQLVSADLAGKRSLIYFFITTCGDCKKVTPVMQGVWEKVSNDDNYRLIIVNRGESMDTVDEYFSSNGVTMPYYLDQLKETYNKFAEKYVPRVYIVDENGIVEWMTTEEKLPDNADTAEELFQLLK